MANVYTANPIKVDTAMATGFIAAGGTAPLNVAQIEWVGPVTAGDTLTIIDPISSNVLFTTKAAAPDLGRALTYPFNPRLRWADFKVSVLSSGTVYIYV